MIMTMTWRWRWFCSSFFCRDDISVHAQTKN